MGLNFAVTDTKWSPNFSSGRPAGKPTHITIHHWGVTGQKHQNVVDYLCRQNGNSSAHYVASSGRVTQLVHDYDRAWHAGAKGNPRGIGIECRPEMTAGDFETVAQLIAAIRAQWGDLPLTKHKDFMDTSCPGPWANRLAALDKRAREIAAGKTAAKPTTTNSTSSKAGKLAVDGLWGPATTRALQQINKTPVDGVVSSQPTANKRYLGGVTGWEFVSNPKGSLLIKTMQKAFRVTQDGFCGPDTIRGMQRYYGTKVDGVISPGGSSVVMAMQRAINKQLGGK